MIDLIFRSFSRARWIVFATTRGVYDAQGVVQPGFHVDEIGNLVITPAVWNDLTLTTPAVMDTWWTINLRFTGSKASDDEDTLYTGETDTGFKFTKSKLVRFVREQATPVTIKGWRAYQFGAAANRVQLIDPRDVTVPPRVWLGGMDY